MVLVVFGNVPIPFQRLADAVSSLCKRSSWRWVIQRGYTSHDFSGAEVHDFVSADKMRRLMEEAAVIVSHGGYGTISEALRLGKKVIAVPRMQGEHNHSQRELVEALEKGVHVLATYNVADLGKKIEESESFSPKPLPKGDAFRRINDFIAANFPDRA